MLDQLKAAQASIVTQIVTAAANIKPSYSIDGQSVSAGDYFRQLSEALKAVNELIVAFEPFELRSQVA